MGSLRHAPLLPVTVFLLAVTSAGQPLDSPSIVVVVAVAQDQEGPLRVTGLQLPETVGGAPKVVVQNTSDRQVRFFVLEGILGTPDPADIPGSGKVRTWLRTQRRPTEDKIKEVEQETGLAFPQRGPDPLAKERTVSPYGQAETYEPRLRSLDLASFAKRYLHSCLLVVVHVSEVEFADGTAWHSSPALEQKTGLWSKSLRAQGLGTCVNSLATDRMLDTVEAVTGLLGKPTRASGEVVQHYVVECPVRRLKGKNVALCTM